MIPMVMIVPARVMVIAQKPRAKQIDSKAKHSDHDRLVISDRHRMNDPHSTLIGDLDSDQGEYNGAGECSKVAEFAGTECKARIAAMLTCEQIREPSDAESGRMSRHVPAIGGHSHLSKKKAG